MDRHRRTLLVAIALLACDPARAPEPAATTAGPVAKTEPAPIEPAPAKPAPIASDPTPPAVEPPPVEPPPVEPAPPAPVASDETFAATIERLGDRLPREVDAGKLGFAKLKAGAHDDAQTYFAQASALDSVAWKHPFNLACAASLAKDEAVARIALGEAIARGGDTVVQKARRDGDLANVRTASWFEPVLRGEWPPKAPPPDVTPPPAIAPAVLPPAVVTPPPVVTPPADPAPPPEPAIAFKALPKGTAKKIAKAQLAPIITALATTHLAKPVIHGSLEYTDARGTTMRWVVYEFSLFDACLAKQPDKKKGKRFCREEIALTPGSGQCNSQGIALVTSLDPVTVAHDENLDATCKLRRVNRLEVADYDGDTHDEILVELRGRYSREEERTAEMTDYVHAIRILRPDGSTQLKSDIRWSYEAEIEISETARKIGIRADDDGEGMRDLVFAFRDFEGTDDILDDGLWPNDEDEELVGPIKTEVWKYDPEADVWRDPTP
jgi:hypothetical protein